VRTYDRTLPNAIRKAASRLWQMRRALSCGILSMRDAPGTDRPVLWFAMRKIQKNQTRRGVLVLSITVPAVRED